MTAPQQSLPAPHEVLPHKPPFLYIDEVLRCTDTEVCARRKFAADEDFFRGHFPGQPLVPGVLLIEAMAQTFAYLALLRGRGVGVHLTGVDRARFRRPVLPEQEVEITVEVKDVRLGLYRAKGLARVDGVKVADALLTGRVLSEEELAAVSRLAGQD